MCVPIHKIYLNACTYIFIYKRYFKIKQGINRKFCNCGSKVYIHKSVFSDVLLRKADQHKVKKKVSLNVGL